MNSGINSLTSHETKAISPRHLHLCLLAARQDERKGTHKVLPIASIFDLYAEEKARLALAGKPTGEFDLLIGCTAVAKDMILVTENVKDFQNIKDIQIENWIERDK